MFVWDSTQGDGLGEESGMFSYQLDETFVLQIVPFKRTRWQPGGMKIEVVHERKKCCSLAIFATHTKQVGYSHGRRRMKEDRKIVQLYNYGWHLKTSTEASYTRKTTKQGYGSTTFMQMPRYPLGALVVTLCTCGRYTSRLSQQTHCRQNPRTIPGSQLNDCLTDGYVASINLYGTSTQSYNTARLPLPQQIPVNI